MIFYMRYILDIKFHQYISSTYEAMIEIKLTEILSFVEYKNTIFLFAFFFRISYCIRLILLIISHMYIVIINNI